MLARSGDHSHVLVAANDASGEVALFDNTGKIVVGPQTVGGGSISYVAANHDASRFAGAFSSNGIHQVLLLDARLNQIAARTVSLVRGLSFSPDGTTLFASEATASLPAIDVLDGMNLHVIGQVSDFAVQGVSTELEEVSETKMLFGIANRGISFLDASNPSALSATAPQFSALPVAQPSEGANSGGTSVILSGQDFESGSQVIFGALPATSVTVSSASQILATSPASANVGPVNITVLSLSGWVALAPEAFTYGPHMNQILPNAATASGGDAIQIYGSGFGSDASKLTVSIGGQNASIQKLESTSTIAPSLGLDANYPFALHGGFLAVDENGQKIFALTASGLTVVELAVVPLELGTVSPATVSVSGGAMIKVRGSGFLTGCTATLGGKSATVVFLDMNTLNVTVPVLAAGPQRLVVSNPGGESISWDAAILAN